MIARIPRMEKVAEIVANQNRRINDEAIPALKYDEVDDATVGSRILKVVLDYDKLIISGNAAPNALKELTERVGWYDIFVLDVLKNLVELAAEEYTILELNISQLKPGMILDRHLLSKRGSMFLSAGQEITISLILRLINFAEAGMITNRVHVKVPVKPVQAMPGFNQN